MGMCGEWQNAYANPDLIMDRVRKAAGEASDAVMAVQQAEGRAGPAGWALDEKRRRRTLPPPPRTEEERKSEKGANRTAAIFCAGGSDQI